MIDYHLHTSFSYDSKANIFDVCKKAQERGLKYIAITDHLDFDDSFGLDMWNIEDLHGKNGYINSIKKMQEEFPMLDITFGLETGYTPSGYDLMLQKVEEINPDFIIGSVHFIDGHDLYYKDYFEGKTKKQAYNLYLESVYNSIEPLSKYAHIVGHIGYICKSRMIPYDDISMKYTDYKSAIDDILKSVISHDMGIEINTSGLLSKANVTLPDFDIVRRYKQLGGKILTIGSDAHLVHNVGNNIDTALDMAMCAGFTYLSIFKKGEIKHIKI